jgi:BirA family biotin operon repressor/biotin-[acetyl-CoA-carboxylase] ligase
MNGAAPLVYRHAVVASTQDLAHELAEQGAPAGTVVTAEEQTGGRGSRGRAWGSPRGGLWLSVVLRPPTARSVEVLSLRLGLAVAGALEEAAALRGLALKWPNDLLLGGRKVGGILCEARWQGATLSWVAVGVGLNVRNQISAELRGVAVSLAEERPDIADRELLDSVMPAVRGLDLCAERLSEEELVQFSGRHWLAGRVIREPVTGTVGTVDSDGTLQVRLPEGTCLALRNASIELATVTPIP